MKSTRSFARHLRLFALIVLAAGLIVWVSSGARVGWTQTSIVSIQRDEITGIEFPVRRDAFVAGVEVPLLATAIAALAAGLSVLVQRRRAPTKA
jgi:hypothetical protein